MLVIVVAVTVLVMVMVMVVVMFVALRLLWTADPAGGLGEGISHEPFREVSPSVRTRWILSSVKLGKDLVHVCVSVLLVANKVSVAISLLLLSAVRRFRGGKLKRR